MQTMTDISLFEDLAHAALNFAEFVPVIVSVSN